MLINIVSELLGEQTRFQMLSKLNCQCVPGRWIRKSDSVSTKGAPADPTIFQAWAYCIYMAGRQWLSGVVRKERRSPDSDLFDCSPPQISSACTEGVKDCLQKLNVEASTC